MVYDRKQYFNQDLFKRFHGQVSGRMHLGRYMIKMRLPKLTIRVALRLFPDYKVASQVGCGTGEVQQTARQEPILYSA